MAETIFLAQSRNYEYLSQNVTVSGVEVMATNDMIEWTWPYVIEGMWKGEKLEMMLRFLTWMVEQVEITVNLEEGNEMK